MILILVILTSDSVQSEKLDPETRDSVTPPRNPKFFIGFGGLMSHERVAESQVDHAEAEQEGETEPLKISPASTIPEAGKATLIGDGASQGSKAHRPRPKYVEEGVFRKISRTHGKCGLAEDGRLQDEVFLEGQHNCVLNKGPCDELGASVKRELFPNFHFMLYF